MRMMIDIPQKWKQSWDTWELQVCIISSLSLQTFLIFFAPLRKRTSSTWLIIPLWSAYLLADWVANFSLGLILNNQGNPNGEEELLAFWAPFLLVHLGGPDTITAFALEDNEFWLRHLIGLVIQFSATVYVFVRSLPHNQLWLPTILMLMNGTIKYAERTSAFYLASAERFKQSINTNIQMTPKPGNENLTEWEVVRHAYYFFSTFKGRVVDQVFKRTAWEESREFFLKQTAKDAFPVVEVELNFIYLVLFTKLPVLNGHFRTIRPLVSFVLICPAIVLFFKVQKTKFSTIDVRITYGLLFNALALDILALLMLLFSVNTVLLLSKSLEPGKEPLWLRILIIFHTRSNPSKQRWPIQFFNRRWSETIRTYNIIDFCLHPHSRFKKFVCSLLGLRVYVDSIRYVKTKRLTENLKDFIFDELKSKSNDAKLLNEATKISSSRGDRVLSDEASWSHILPYTLDDDFGQRILLWHVATNLCYNKEINDGLKSEGRVNTKNKHRDIAEINDELKSEGRVNTKDKYRDMAMLLSDYMMYLLIMKPSMMSAITSTVQTQFLDLCADFKSIFKSGKFIEVNKVRNQRQRSENIEVDWEQLNACMEILAIPDDVWLRNVKGDQKNSLLLYSYTLAKEVMKIEEEDRSLNKWLIISKVWVELLCYGASHSQSKVQAAQVSSGGELITIVWLMMAQLGLGDQFQYDEQQKKARLIVD